MTYIKEVPGLNRLTFEIGKETEKSMPPINKYLLVINTYWGDADGDDEYVISFDLDDYAYMQDVVSYLIWYMDHHHNWKCDNSVTSTEEYRVLCDKYDIEILDGFPKDPYGYQTNSITSIEMYYFDYNGIRYHVNILIPEEKNATK